MYYKGKLVIKVVPIQKYVTCLEPKTASLAALDAAEGTISGEFYGGLRGTKGQDGEFYGGLRGTKGQDGEPHTCSFQPN